ncbi:hypothetical protein [Legionella cardiaca]|uniref:Uncharacterized protein n=1 Tax=Legionella cardiaca TaxID=1071983 RepID=A0ABY8ATE1_9GAMM|nr:hypothetical protein [Legionella cardiaca]WED43938.1 hypothetical protein PXX05_03910 [Legionella cardiaca]
MFKKLWQGDMPLWITFWIFGVLMISLGRLLIGYANDEEFISKYGIIPLYLLIVLWLGYATFILVSIWRSASKYTGAELLAALSQLAVFFGAVAILLSLDIGLFNKFFKENKDINQILVQQAEILNQSLPTQINKHMELYKVVPGDHSLSYYYRLVNFSKGELNFLHTNYNEAVQQLVGAVKPSACNNESVKWILKNNIDFFYYYELDGEGFYKLHLNKDECGIKD